MTDHQKPDKKAQAGELLEELESIKSLLDDEDLDSIPLLEEMIDDEMPIVTQPPVPDELPTLDNPSKLPGQKSLFGESAGDKPKSQKPRTLPSTENPFLPKHIRERLGSSTGYVQELEQQQRNLEKLSLTMPFSHQVPSKLDVKGDQKSRKTPLQTAITNPDDLIESLVQQYLPIIEDDLRQRLKALIDEP